jgi:hypothetical protein
MIFRGLSLDSGVDQIIRLEFDVLGVTELRILVFPSRISTACAHSLVD